MQTVMHPPTVPVGLIKSFGADGPKYEVGKPLYPLENGDWMVEIVILDSGEHVEYARTSILDDPEAV